MRGSGGLTRSISLRLSESEYETLKAQCQQCGAATVSDLARLAIQRLTHSSPPTADLASRVYEIESRLNALERCIARSLGEKDRPSASSR